jgi:hypothetical protein
MNSISQCPKRFRRHHDNIAGEHRPPEAHDPIAKEGLLSSVHVFERSHISRGVRIENEIVGVEYRRLPALPKL